jgi:hypothetical protein
LKNYLSADMSQLCEETKECITCKKTLFIRFFYKQKTRTGRTAYRGKCAICYSTYRKEKGWDAKYYAKCKTKTFNTKEK